MTKELKEGRSIDTHKPETLFWQTRVNITQAPEIFIPKELPESAVPFYQTPGDIRTFLYDPFGKDPSRTYGLELTANDKIEVFFSLKQNRNLKRYN